MMKIAIKKREAKVNKGKDLGKEILYFKEMLEEIIKSVTTASVPSEDWK